MKRLLLILLLAAAWSATAAEKPVTLKRDFGTLYGTLLMPDTGAETVALIIAGSGPTDRNGNNPLGVNTNMYLYLAQALEQAGIASLRYDKRAIGTSRLDDPTAAMSLTLDHYIDDAAALADFLAAQGFRRVVLVGHSEGALIALRAAQLSDKVSAVVSIAGPGYPMDEILLLQLAGQLALTNMPLLLEANAIITSLKGGEKVDMEYHSRELQMLFNPALQTFWISTFRYDPRELIREVQVPVLIVNGDNDVQISVDNAEALSQAQPRAKKAIIPGLTHTLKKSDARTLPEQTTTVYADPSLPLDPDLAAAVTGFIGAL